MDKEHEKAIQESQRYPDRIGCGLCSHRVNRHDRIDGCHDCDCMATTAEAVRGLRGHTPSPVHYSWREPAPYVTARDVLRWIKSQANNQRSGFSADEWENVAHAAGVHFGISEEEK